LAGFEKLKAELDALGAGIFTTNPLRSIPCGGAQGSEVNIRCIARDKSEQVHAIDYSAPATRFGFSAELTSRLVRFLSFRSPIARAVPSANNDRLRRLTQVNNSKYRPQ